MGNLTTETPIVHPLLSNCIKDGVHVGSSLGRIDVRSMLAHRVFAGPGTILRSRVHFTSFKLNIPGVALNLLRSLRRADVATSLRNRTVDPTRIEAKQMELLSDDLVYRSSCSPEKVDPTA